MRVTCAASLSLSRTPTHTVSLFLSHSLACCFSSLTSLPSELLYLLLSLAHTEIAQRFASVFNCCQWVNKWPGTLYKRGQLNRGVVQGVCKGGRGVLATLQAFRVQNQRILLQLPKLCSCCLFPATDGAISMCGEFPQLCVEFRARERERQRAGKRVREH